MDQVLKALSFLPGFHNAHSIDITFLFMLGSEETQSVYWIYLLSTDFMFKFREVFKFKALF